MNTAKIAGLTFIPLGVVGMSQFHYVVSHMTQIATGAAAVGLGVAVYGGHSIMGKVKVRSEERKQAKAEAIEQSAVDERIMRLTEAMEARQSLPQAQPQRGMVIDHTGAVVQRHRG